MKPPQDEILWDLSSAGRASALQAEGHRFEPYRSHLAADAAGDDAAADTSNVDYGTGEITIWVAENVQTFTQNQIKAFQEANPQYAGYTVTVEPVGEGEAATNMITDVEGGADIYGFAHDQLARLVSSGAIMPVTGDYATWVAEQNDAVQQQRLS